MSERATPRVAVIADTSLQRHVLQQALLGHGYEVVLNADPVRSTTPRWSARPTCGWWT